MKNKLALLFTLALSAVALVGCGDSKDKIDTDKQVTLGEYKGIEVTVDAVNVTEEDINNYINEQLSTLSASNNVTNRPVQSGDTVNIVYVGKKDGVPFDGGSTDEAGYDLTIGSGAFIPGFEDGLIGAELGQTLDLNLTFPETYGNEELAGAAVVFTVTVNSISERVTPGLTLDTAKALKEGVESVEDYKTYVRSFLQDQAELYHDYQISDQVFNKVLETSVVKDIPKDLLDRYIASAKKSVESYANAYKMELEQFLAEGLQITMEEYEAKAVEVANLRAKEDLVIRAIAKLEGLSVTDEEITAFAEEKLQETLLETVEDYIKQIGKEEIEIYLLSDKVYAKLAEYAKVTETQPTAVDTDVDAVVETEAEAKEEVTTEE